MKIYNVEKERLQLFVDRYENFIKTAPFVKKEFSPADKDCLSMMLIDFCCICEQNQESDAYWNNELIDNFVKDNFNFYRSCKVLRDSFYHAETFKTAEEAKKTYMENLCIFDGCWKDYDRGSVRVCEIKFKSVEKLPWKESDI